MTTIETEKMNALAYINDLPANYKLDSLDFDVIVSNDDTTQTTVEVSPYWASLDTLDAGGGIVDEYDGHINVSIDDIPTPKNDLIIRVVTRDFENQISEEVTFYPSNNYTNLVTL